MVRGSPRCLGRRHGEPIRTRRGEGRGRVDPDRPATSEDFRKLLGRRVTVRYRRLADPAHPFSEAAGVVQSVVGDGDDAVIAIVTRRGRVAEIALRDVVVAKVIRN